MRHNKLVRDNIPAIITRQGEHRVTRNLDVGEYRDELRRKLHEEVEEFGGTGSAEELVDILEVVTLWPQSKVPASLN